MTKTFQKFIAYTFAVIAAVVLLTHSKAFGQIMSASASGYRTIVGSFITPSKA